MERKNLIGQCRYYRGQSVNPNIDNTEMAWFWDMERIYVRCNGNFEGEKDYYERLGGKKYPGIPYPLLIILFTSWGKTEFNIEANLNKFYKLIDDYLFIPNDHFPEDKIPNKL